MSGEGDEEAPSRQLFDDGPEEELPFEDDEDDDDALLAPYGEEDYDTGTKRAQIVEREVPVTKTPKSTYTEKRDKDKTKGKKTKKSSSKKGEKEVREQSEFDRIMESAKLKRRKRQITEEEAATRVNNFITRMKEAADQDDHNLANGLPAVAKLTMLDEVCIEIVKPAWTAWYLQEGLLGIMEKWLTPLPDGSLPNLTLRTKILNTLTKIHCSPDYMANTSLGERLLELWRSPEESEENRQSIRKIVNAIIKPILGIRYNGQQQDLPHVERASSTQNPLRHSTFRAAPPRVEARQFRVAPKSQVMPSEGRPEEGEVSRLQKMMDAKLRQPKRKAPRTGGYC